VTRKGTWKRENRREKFILMLVRNVLGGIRRAKLLAAANEVEEPGDLPDGLGARHWSFARRM